MTEQEYQDAKAFVIDRGRVGLGWLQKHRRVSFATAWEMIQRMEKEGVIVREQDHTSWRWKVL